MPWSHTDITHFCHPLPITVTPVTPSQKGNYISSDADLSGHPEYTNPMSNGSLLVENMQNTQKEMWWS
jgi:hypothetical protein